MKASRLTYLSVCSGIEAATVAWHSLGWKPVAFSEIDPFPCAVLNHYYPETPNLGDMTKHHDWTNRIATRPDAIVGGTPCQAFSLAGLRKGLDDPRGNLTLVFLSILDQFRPRWVVWENVPGVLSSTTDDLPDALPPEIDLDGDNGPRDGEEIVVEDEHDGHETHALGCFLSGLRELGYGYALRSFDAQYFGLAQRRERVFVVASAGDWAGPAAVLFEPEGLRGDPAPRRETRERIAGTIGASFARRGYEDRGDGGGVPLIPEIAHTLRAEGHDASEDGTGRGVPIILATGQSGAEIGINMSPTLSCNHEAPICVHGTQDPCTSETHAFALGRNNGQENAIAFASTGSGYWKEGVGTLRAREQDSHENLIAFTCKDHGSDAGEIAPTLRSMGHDKSHANAGGQVAVAFAENSRSEIRLEGGDGQRTGALSTGGGKAGQGVPMVATEMKVRRLTPRECERLQGFPDDYTQIPYRGKSAENCPDGPRYKALGNSMAVPVMHWIGERIGIVDAIRTQAKSKNPLKSKEPKETKD